MGWLRSNEILLYGDKASDIAKKNGAEKTGDPPRSNGVVSVLSRVIKRTSGIIFI